MAAYYTNYTCSLPFLLSKQDLVKENVYVVYLVFTKFPATGCATPEKIWNAYKENECFVTDYEDTADSFLPFVSLAEQENKSLSLFCFERVFCLETWDTWNTAVESSKSEKKMQYRIAPDSEDYFMHLMNYFWTRATDFKEGEYVWTAFGNLTGSEWTRFPGGFTKWESGNATEEIEEGSCVAVSVKTGLWKQIPCKTKLTENTIYGHECKASPTEIYETMYATQSDFLPPPADAPHTSPHQQSYPQFQAPSPQQLAGSPQLQYLNQNGTPLTYPPQPVTYYSPPHAQGLLTMAPQPQYQGLLQPVTTGVYYPPVQYNPPPAQVTAALPRPVASTMPIPSPVPSAYQSRAGTPSLGPGQLNQNTRLGAPSLNPSRGPTPVIPQMATPTLSTVQSAAPSPLPTPQASAQGPPTNSNLPNYRQYQLLTGHTGAICAVRFSPDGRYLASTSDDKTIRIYNVDKGYCLEKIINTSHKHGVSDLVWSPDTRCLRIATCADDMTIKVWDFATSKCIKTMRGHTNYIMSISYDPTGRLIASGSFDGSVRIWDVKSGVCIKTFPAHSDPVSAVAFNRDGSLVCSASYDGLIKIWDTTSGQCLKCLFGDVSPPVSFVKFSPNGKYILASTFDNQINLWDFTRQRLLKTYTGHKNENYCVFSSFSVTGGKWIVSGSEDGKVYLWDLQNKNIAQVIDAHFDCTMAVDCHPEKNIMATGSFDKTVKIWISDY
ncbi:hypothetical protein QR680_010845 [Steinernema hermaphroditum]|uniref:C-type lectin domain-containing protein n=1 Tax=Steinernema hermaphroditum TaxID=289476 RepID=A0AA39IRH6_9BILA|nr:hypothetical protein QR680_010845 [Steinernema hermaphroditum]